MVLMSLPTLIADHWHAAGSASVFAFMLCTALATYAQNLTGFAFSLILLSLVSVLHIATVEDAANAAMVLSLVNAWTYFRARPGLVPWALMRPSLAGSTIGVIAGVTMLAWLSSGAIVYLRGLLGLAIVACSAVLLIQGRALAEVSSRMNFAAVGLLSGLLGGLFASSGPPMVYHMYRQPLERETIRRGLLLVFGFNNLVRMFLVSSTGQFSVRAALLAICAVPGVYAITRVHHLVPSRLPPRTLKIVVAALLAASGTTLIAQSWLIIGPRT
jgi:uncharacterized membrane protein YfcA